MFDKLIDLAKLYITKPTWTRFVLSLLLLAGPIIAFGFGGDWSISIKGILSGVAVDFSYQNKSQLLVSLGAGGLIICAAIWLFIKAQFPSVPRSKHIEDLEDAYQRRGKADSVCQKFLEVHGVFVSPDELEDLMQTPGTSTRAVSLRNARSHIEYVPGQGFRLKKPKYPYKFFYWLFTGLYFFSAVFMALPMFMLATISAASGSWGLFWQFSVGLIASVAVAWSSLRAYAACNSSLIITGG
jgi:hypothetical protein